MNLTDQHVQDICQPDQGRAGCRFLEIICGSAHCLKDPSLPDRANQLANLDEQIRVGTLERQGDNCPGIR